MKFVINASAPGAVRDSNLRARVCPRAEVVQGCCTVHGDPGGRGSDVIFADNGILKEAPFGALSSAAREFLQMALRRTANFNFPVGKSL